jgi:thiol:disulfide interchange protein
MVEISAAGCAACERLEEEVLSRPDVVGASRGFVAVRVDGDKQPELKKQLEVSGYPTIVFLRGDGREIGRVRGAVPYQVMLEEMAKVGQKGTAAAPR